MPEQAGRSGHEGSEHDPAPPGPDQTQARSEHDARGRAGGSPYVPPGRDEAGTPQPAVPHEGLLGRLGTIIVLAECLILLAVAVAGFVVSWGAPFTAQVDTSVLALRLNAAHSTILAVTAVVGFAATYRRRYLRWFAGATFAGYLLLFVFGSAFSVNTAGSTLLNLNTPDHVLHGVVAMLGFVTLMVASARIVEPPPGENPQIDPGRRDRGWEQTR